MKIFSKCPVCNKRAIVLKQRTYKPKSLGMKITSNNEICRICFIGVKKITK